MKLYNALSSGTSAPTGAMADKVWGGNFNVFASQTGIDWYGGQYGEIALMKFDMDGSGSCCIRLRGGVAYPSHGTGLGSDNSSNYAAGTSPSAGKMMISHIAVEASGNSLDATSVVFDVWAGVAPLTFVGCDIGGGTPVGGNGYWIGVNGTGNCDDVKIIGGSTVLKSVAITFGPHARKAIVMGHTFSGSPASGAVSKYALWQAGCIDCAILDCSTDASSNPIIDAARFDYSTAGVVRPWIRGLTWIGGSCDNPSFNGAPPSTFGRDGSMAYNSTAHTLMTKLNGSWLTVTAA